MAKQQRRNNPWLHWSGSHDQRNETLPRGWLLQTLEQNISAWSLQPLSCHRRLPRSLKGKKKAVVVVVAVKPWQRRRIDWKCSISPYSKLLLTSHWLQLQHDSKVNYLKTALSRSWHFIHWDNIFLIFTEVEINR